MRSSAFPPAGMLMTVGNGCDACMVRRSTWSASGRGIRGRRRGAADRVRVAAAVQQVVLVLHVGEGFWVEVMPTKWKFGSNPITWIGYSTS